MSNALSFGVIESAWDMKLAYSVRPIFDLFSHVTTNKIDGYNYERVVGPASFEEVLALQLRQKLQFILISCHGESGDLSLLPSGRKVGATSIKRVIESEKCRPIGLIVDACEFANSRNASAILSTGVTWFASYEKKVDWLESVSFVLLFCATLLKQRGKSGSEPTHAEKTMKILQKNCGGLIKQLGFRLYVWAVTGASLFVRRACERGPS